MTIAAGLDVARYGNDLCAFAVIDDLHLVALDEWAKTGLMDTATRARDMALAHGVQMLAVDDTGVGGGVTDRLIQMLEEDLEDGEEADLLILPVNFGSAADDAKRFHNKASEMWWRGREALDPAEEERLRLPAHHKLRDRLTMQLASALYRKDATGRIWVEKDGERSRRPGDPPAPSPDLADAVMLAMEAWSQFWEAEGQQTETRYFRPSFLGRSAGQAFMEE